LLTRVPDENELLSLQEAQERLASGMSFAAARGILQPNQLDIDLPLQGNRSQIDTSIFDSSMPTIEDPQEIVPQTGHLRITSSSDEPSVASEISRTSTTRGSSCIDPVEIRVQDWRPESNFGASISLLRGRLFSEFDELNHETAVQLARLYLHFGFGAEAKNVLSLDANMASDNMVLVDIANIMEFGSDLGRNYLENFLGCNSDAALWAILASKEIQPNTPIASKAALLTLSSLPLHLRNFLAPALSKKFLTYGDEAAATAALRGLERTTDKLPNAAELAKADIELAQGYTAEAQTRLEDIVESNDQQSAEALIKFVNAQLDAEIDIDESVATLVQAYAMEMRNDPIGMELQRTYVLALAKSNQFDSAFKALGQMPDGVGPADSGVTFSTLVDLLANNADDPTFLKHAFAVIAKPDAVMAAQTSESVAQRLANLGFYVEAEDLLSTEPAIRATREGRILRAQISLNLSRPRTALAYLNGVEGAAAESLRAIASLQAGEHETAYEMLSDSNDTGRRVQAAWLSDNWQDLLSNSDDPVLKPVAAVASSELDTSLEQAGILKRLQDAVDESASARKTLQNMLATYRSDGEK